MSVPSANTRDSRNVRSTASQPLIEKPTSRSIGCAGVEIGLRRSPPKHHPEKLQRDHDPGDRLQTLRVRGDERVARANRLDDREQPLEAGMIEWNCDQAERGDRAQAHDHTGCVRRRREIQSAHDPLLVREDEQQREDQWQRQPVDDDQDPEQDVRDRQRG